MCDIYASTDPDLYECTTRSVRIGRVVTSVRIERRFWQILERIAAEEGISVSQFLTKLYEEVTARRGSVENFASLLRVVCTVYQDKRAGGLPSIQQTTPDRHQSVL
jgi:predicted DNA-binding ribbon-helix-helix protein